MSRVMTRHIKYRILYIEVLYNPEVDISKYFDMLNLNHRILLIFMYKKL